MCALLTKSNHSRSLVPGRPLHEQGMRPVEVPKVGGTVPASESLGSKIGVSDCAYVERGSVS